MAVDAPPPDQLATLVTDVRFLRRDADLALDRTSRLMMEQGRLEATQHTQAVRQQDYGMKIDEILQWARAIGKKLEIEVKTW